MSLVDARFTWQPAKPEVHKAVALQCFSDLATIIAVVHRIDAHRFLSSYA